MDRYEATFSKLSRRNEGAFVPFTVLGDPNPATSLAVLEAFVAGGADMLELGIPFSDPVADGPVIQAADARALDAGVTPPMALDILAEFRKRHADVPVGLLMYANLLYGPGLDQGFTMLAQAGVDSVLVADVPLEESPPFRRAGKASGVALISMVTPLTPDDRLAAITSYPAPYLYVVSRSGVTGGDERLADSAAPLLARIGSAADIPTLLGFGISEPDHVRQALAAGATGAISGSAVVSIIGRHASSGLARATQRRGLTAEITAFVTNMKAATRG